jgi:hypothetical protein
MTDEAQVQTGVVAPTGVQPEQSTDATPAPQEAEDNAQPTNEAQKDGEAQEAKPAEEPFPKKAVNAIQRRDRTIRQLRAQMRELSKGQTESAAAPAAQSSDEPKPENFETYGEYLEARVDYKLAKELKGREAQQQKDTVQTQQADIRKQQTEIIGEQIQQFAKTSADFAKVMQENAEFISNLPMPAHIEELLYELDNTPLAVYALTKEGRLEDVYGMSPHLAAAELISAQQRGQGYLNAVSQAPKPMTPVKGIGSTSKRAHEMTADEVVAWANTK